MKISRDAVTQLLRILCVVLCSLSLSPRTRALDAREGRNFPRLLLIAVNQGDRDISLIDPRRNREIARISVGATTGHEVATSKDGRLAFVPIYGDSTPGKPGSDGNEVVVIDLDQKRIVHRISFGHGVRPHCIVSNPRDGLLYVTTELDQTVSVIDPVSFRIVGAIHTGRPQSHMFALSPDGRFGYTANINTGSVSVLDLATRKLIRVIQVAAEVQRISVSPDGEWIFTADQQRPRMAVISAHRYDVERWIDLPAIGYGSASTRNGQSLLITLPDIAKVMVVGLHDFRIATTVEVPPGPHEVLMDPDQKTAFVACTTADAVARINLSRWSVSATIPVGRTSDGIGWVPARP